MPFRYTQRDLRAQLELFAKASGLRIAKSYDDVGALTLDHLQGSGWRVDLIYSTTGATSQPWGARRRSLPEMIDVLFFARDTLELMDRRKGGYPP